MIYSRSVSIEELKIAGSDFEQIDASDAAEYIRAELETVIERASEILACRGVIRLLDEATIRKDHFVSGGIHFSCGRKITGQLNRASSLAVFACTAGAGVTAQYHEYMSDNDPLKAYFTDRLGSIAVEKTMDILQSEFGGLMKNEALQITNRYSPGYCGWPLTDQRFLFDLLSPEPCGITLTESSLMVPSKSISGVIGVGHEVRFTQHECRLCELEKCLYRKKRIQEAV